MNASLLSKISGTDQEFKNEISQLINIQAKIYLVRMSDLISTHKYHGCYIETKKYFARLQAYMHESFLTRFQRNLSKLKHCKSEVEKHEICLDLQSIVHELIRK